MRLLPYVVALIGVLALVGWFGWDARRPLAASRRATRDSTNPDDAGVTVPDPALAQPRRGRRPALTPGPVKRTRGCPARRTLCGYNWLISYGHLGDSWTSESASCATP